MALLIALLMLSACTLVGCAIPKDPEHSLQRASGGVLRVGVSANPPWTEVSGQQTPAGIEVRLVEDYARSIGADIEWSVGAESILVSKISENELDLVIGGFDSRTPWKKYATTTRPYARTLDAEGKPVKRVWLCAQGENALLSSVESELIENPPQGLPGQVR